MRNLTLCLAATLVACMSLAECNEGVAYGGNVSLLSNTQSVGKWNFWVAGTKNGPVLDHFLLFDLAPSTTTYFTADQILLFTTGKDPLVGKTCEVWLRGRSNFDTSPVGTTRIARCVFSDSAGSLTNSVEYMVFELYSTQNLSKPIFSRLYITYNLDTVHILNACDDDPIESGIVYGEEGVVSIFGRFRTAPISAITNRLNSANVLLWIAGTEDGCFLLGPKFQYAEAQKGVTTRFEGDRCLSFQCTNHGAFGKQADFWLEGRFGSGDSNAVRLAHVIVTESAAPYGLEFMYIAVYHPLNLAVPVYQRIVFFPNGLGTVDVLCPDH